MSVDAKEAGLDRYFLQRRRLLGAPRDSRKLSLREVRAAGRDLANDPNDLRIFGLNPLAWHLLGLRIVGRTAVEATRDIHADFFARAVARTLSEDGQPISAVIDPFAGSGNLLFHVLRATGSRRAVMLDVNPYVLDLTKKNFRLLRIFGRLHRTRLSFHRKDWSSMLDLLEDQPTLVLLSPPWGDAFDRNGLDLRKTNPPVPTILRRLASLSGTAPLFAAVQTHPMMVAESVKELTSQYHAYPSHRSDHPVISQRFDYLLFRIR